MKANIFFGSKETSTQHYDDRYNPYTHKVVSQVSVCSAADANRALEIASKTTKLAKDSTIATRCSWMLDVANRLRECREDMAQTITDEVAKPIKFARIEVDRCVETITLAAEFMRTMSGETINTDAMDSGRKTTAFYFREPCGVVVAITPFNFPLNLIAHKLAPALVAGNTVVLKPTPEAPLTAYKFAKLFIQSKYATKDALSLVYGDAEVGSALVSSEIPRVISFTGSVQVGKIITRQAGIKKLALELGGNAATYIDTSANLKQAASKCALGAFVNSGQVCISLQRIYVDSAIHDEFASLLATEIEKLKVGSPYDEDTFMSAMIDQESCLRAVGWIESAIESGAKALTKIQSNNNTLHPTLLSDVDDSMDVACEEVFAPIVSLMRVDGFKEACERMNSTPYGIQFSIFTNSVTQMQDAIHNLDVGGVVINEMPTLRFDIQPYGGVKLSGIGKEGPRYAIEEMSEIKTVTIC